MLTNDTNISSPGYWDRIYRGDNKNAKVDSSNTPRPANTFDRFQWVADQTSGPIILDVGSGHAHVPKRIKAMHPTWYVVASDQSEEAMKVANYKPYKIFDAYKIPFPNKYFDQVIITQAMEYLEFPGQFLREAKRVGKSLLGTVPFGEMKSWSQLRIYDEVTLATFLAGYGTLQLLDIQNDLIIFKIKFDD